MKLRSLYLFFCLIAGQGLFSQDLFQEVLLKFNENSVPYIRVSELLNSSEELIFLDAREQKEYQVSHIPKALWVGYKNFDLNRVTRQLKNKEQKIVVYCSIGVRSEDIAEQLMQHGYENVFNLYGGIFAWFNEKQPLYNADEKPTNRIHAYSERWGTYLNRGIKIYD